MRKDHVSSALYLLGEPLSTIVGGLSRYGSILKVDAFSMDTIMCVDLAACSWYAVAMYAIRWF
jgi:hypothetical protein